MSTPRTTSPGTGGSVLEEVLRCLVVMVASRVAMCWVDGTGPLGRSEP
ncbi:hypothetical protein [Streptomyces europaeiscabiei]|nr:hypothetical protein [Streptomyces europaeiscabiei]